MKGILIGCLALALIAAVVYFLMGINVIPIPIVNGEKAQPSIVYVAAGCYLTGGFLILLRKRWLWIIGLIANSFVIAIFFLAYNQKPDIMFSLPGLVTKIAQILLEAGLIYLLVTFKKEKRSGQLKNNKSPT
jgi:hypothetical protein